MRQNLPFFILLTAVVMCIVFSGCTRELTSGETIRQPFQLSTIPANEVSNAQTEQSVQPSAGSGEPGGVTTPQTVGGGAGESSNPEVVALMNEGRQAIMNRDFQGAIDTFMKVIAIEPNNVKALYNLGYSYRQTGDKDKAIEFAERAVQADPDQLYVHQNLGFAYEDAGQIDKAMSEFEEELRRHPDDPNLAGIAAKLAQIYLDRDLLEEAFDAASRAVRLSPDNPANHYVLAQVHMKNKAYDQAIVSLQKALELAPDSAYYRVGLGNALWEAGRKDEARKYYNEAIGIDPGVADQIDRSRLTE